MTQRVVGSIVDGVSDLRARRHRETERDILGAALELFRADGYDGVTIEQIADAAGVSRRTVYRRFPTKEHVVLAVPRAWLEVWDEAVAGCAADAPALAVAEAGALAVARHIDADAARVLAVYAILEQAPWLESAGLVNRAWSRRIVDLLVDARRGAIADAGVGNMVAGAYLGAIDSMMANWSTSGGRTRVVDETAAVLERLRPIWPRVR